MKKIKLLTLIAFVFAGLSVYATDLNVNETGTGGAYTSINDALTAAVDGDRIFIEPKAGGASYIESFTVTKSVQFLCNVEGGKFLVQGDVIIAPSTTEEMSFIGMELAGNLYSTVDASAAGRTLVKILYCDITGYVDFDYNNYDLTMANSSLNGYVKLRSGRLFGNEITTTNYHSIYLLSESAGGAPQVSDTIQIIGNRINNTNSSSYCVYLNSTNYFYQVNNNYMYYTVRGLSINNWTTSLSGTHEVLNNTFKRYTYSITNYGMYFYNIPAGGVLKVHNNLLDGYNASSAYAISLSSMGNGLVYMSYNYMDSGFDYYITGGTNDGTNVIGASFTVDATTGEPTSGTFANVGHPDAIYTDHDLSRNDVGCYGGSQSAENYFPSGDANNARIFNLSIPKAVYTGNPIQVEAEGFDK